MRFPLLMQPDELMTRIDDPSVLVVDASVNLTGDAEGGYTVRSARAGYDAGHIPGAVFADLVTDFSHPNSRYMFTVPDPERIANAAASVGIGDGVHVVAYTQDLPTFAARLWWLLRYFGFADVSVLDGGLRAWRDAGLPVTNQPSAPQTRRRFTARP